MTPTEKQKCIAEQAVYGDLKVLDRDNELWTYAGLGLSELAEGDCALYNDNDNDNVMYDWIDEVKPILRPLSDLTKEITHKGYNDDQPFIPLVELAKINNPEYTSIEINERGRIFINTPYAEDLTMVYDSNNAIFVNMQISKNGNYKLTTSRASINQQPLFDLLNLWHFDTRNLISQSEAINVNTLDINPYSV